MEKKIIEWLVNGDTGISSELMAATACGIDRKKWGPRTPSDPSDFNRCLKLLKAVPEVKNHMPEIANLSETWAALIERWDEVEKCFLEEVGLDWEKSRTKAARKTYELMKEIGC